MPQEMRHTLYDHFRNCNTSSNNNNNNNNKDNDDDTTTITTNATTSANNASCFQSNDAGGRRIKLQQTA